MDYLGVNKMEERLNLINLYDIYGELLTDKQQDYYSPKELSACGRCICFESRRYFRRDRKETLRAAPQRVCRREKSRLRKFGRF